VRVLSLHFSQAQVPGPALVHHRLPSVLVLKQMMMHASAVLCNKCAYYAHRLDRHKDAYWALNNVLPALLADANLRTHLSPHEVDFLHEYDMSIMDFHGNFSAELAVTASIMHPPWDLHVLVHLMCDCSALHVIPRLPFTLSSVRCDDQLVR